MAQVWRTPGRSSHDSKWNEMYSHGLAKTILSIMALHHITSHHIHAIASSISAIASSIYAGYVHISLCAYIAQDADQAI